MTTWRTDLKNVPKDGSKFDVFVRNTNGSAYRECGVFWRKESICALIRDEPCPVEYEYRGGHARVTHWAFIELPDEEDDRPVATQDQIG